MTTANSPARKKASLRRRFRHWRRRQRNRVLIVLGPLLLRLWFSTVKTRWIFPGYGDREARDLTNRIFAIWHAQLLLFVKTHRNTGVRLLISGHGDGQLIAGIVERMGLRKVSGSSTRGGGAAMKVLVEVADDGRGVVITPDGPRGPAYRFRPGAVYLASRTGLPVVPVYARFDRYWELGTWDRFILPKPFSRCVIQTHEEFAIPAGIEREEQESWCRTMEQAHETLAKAAREDFEELFQRGITEAELTSLWHGH